MTANVNPKTILTGDNLPIMRGMNSESVDLINLDPQGSVSEWRQIRTLETPAVITTHPSRLPQILHIARQNDVCQTRSILGVAISINQR